MLYEWLSKALFPTLFLYLPIVECGDDSLLYNNNADNCFKDIYIGTQSRDSNVSVTL